MAIHPDFPKSPHSILNPDVRWFLADEVLWESRYDELPLPLVGVRTIQSVCCRTDG